MFGSVTVWRLGYQAEGVAYLCPLDAGLNLLPELHSFGLRWLVALHAARNSFDEVVEEVELITGTTVHKRKVEELAWAAAQDFDAFYAQSGPPRGKPRSLSPQAGDPDTQGVSSQALLVLTVDGKGIAMRKEDLREATRRAAERQPQAAEAPDQGREAQPQAYGGGGRCLSGGTIRARCRGCDPGTASGARRQNTPATTDQQAGLG